MPDVVARLRGDAVEAAPRSPAQRGEFIETDFCTWRNGERSQKLLIE